MVNSTDKKATQRIANVIACDLGRTEIVVLCNREREFRFPTDRYKDESNSLAALIREVMKKVGYSANETRWAIAVPGPVFRDKVEMPDLPEWTFSRSKIQREIGLDDLQVLNDMVAAILSIPLQIKNGTYSLVIDGKPIKEQPLSLVSVWESVGAAAAFRSDDSPEIWHPLGTEAGHLIRRPEDAYERSITERVTQTLKAYAPSTQTVLAEAGLSALADCLCADQHLPLIGQVTSSRLAEIASDANHKHNRIAMQCALLWSGWMGSFAREIALCYGAQAGIYVTGSVARNFLAENELCAANRSAFAQSFQVGGPTKKYLTKLPVYLLADPEPTLRGISRIGPVRVQRSRQ